MPDASWMVYGSYGYTGELIVREAMKRGMQPVLAGRDGARVREQAQALGLESLYRSNSSCHHFAMW